MNSDLVFDLGMHRGEDTAFYLQKGFRVVGVEADPELAAHCRQRFAAPLAAGSLHLLEGAIVAKEARSQGSIRFYKNLQMSVWGTTAPEWRDRNARLGTASTAIDVRCLDLGAILAEYGVPFYMKIDLEGADRLCLDYLRDLPELPRYLSIEDEKLDLKQLAQDVETLWSLGYRRFAAVQQEPIPGSIYTGLNRAGQPITHPFESGASGPFGPDLDSRWLTREELLVEYKWIYEMYRIFGDNSPFARDRNLHQFRVQLASHLKLSLPGWYDTHAALPAEKD